ncbi:MAG: hypothetical protein KGS61_01070 [Verrucomicrobia bacterium]|nr:hypothetical protein [Verrucomicrobiota bacterium]
MSRIHVHIDRLVLPGPLARDQAAFVAGLETELSRVLSDPTLRAQWAKSRRLPVLRLGLAHLGPGASGSRQFGQALARGIRKGLRR